MPPLISHMITAQRAAAQVDPALARERGGEYLLGSTTPDIRVLTRWERERTHFFALDQEAHQDSVAEFFHAHPYLRDAGVLTPETRAWVCGFFSHLIMDEVYIEQVYRPSFGLRSALGGDARANLLDRVLQYEMDLRQREDTAQMEAIREALFASAVEIDAGFIDRETLEKWRDMSAQMTEHPPDWERFRYVAARHLRGAEMESEEAMRDFLEQVPELLDQSARSVSTAELEAFFERVDARVTAQLREYLACP